MLFTSNTQSESKLCLEYKTKEYLKNIDMINQLQKHDLPKKRQIQLIREAEELLMGKEDFFNTLMQYQSRIQQLENESKNLSKHIEECHDFMALQRDLERKDKAKIQKLENTLQSSGERMVRLNIPVRAIELLIVLSLVAYAVYLFMS